MEITLDFNSVVPLYEQLARRLSELIEEGHWSPGQQLPTESDFSEQHGVSRATVRAALDLLEEEGVVSRRAGKGTFVTQAAIRQSLSELESFPETVASQGASVSIQTVDHEEYVPSYRIRSILGLRAGAKAHRIRRVHFMGDEALATDCVTLPSSIVKNVDLQRLLTSSTYTVFEEELDIALGAATQKVSACAASEELAERLRVPPGEPLLQIERLTYAASGIPVEHLLLHYRADRVVLNVHLPRKALPLMLETSTSVET